MKTHFKLLVLVSAGLLIGACSKPPALLDLQEWDLVWISDSSGWDVAQVYAAMIEEDTGIKVNVHDNWIGGLPAASVYHALLGEPTASLTLERLADEIREAEVIVFYGNPEDSWEEGNPADWLCVNGIGMNYVNNCEMETFDSYIQILEGIYAKIFELRAGQPTIVRAFDAYNPLITRFKEQGSYEDCKACWANYNAAIHQAAASYNVPVAGVALAWNGPNWDQDPVALGYTKDDIHPNQEGARVIAEALRVLGYDPVMP
ncbi:MAG: SGNH/GDSL hydrolase family protein [Anaerolineales bacterium]|nr:MAG: SGNH/GDSL hydrolase family protein [Anaerolineales bacterium]